MDSLSQGLEAKFRRRMRAVAERLAEPLAKRWRAESALRKQAQEGYTLVTLVVMFTVMNILVATALPLWSGVIQRDKEYEFIFRGLQYAEAIRVYQARYGQWPQKLKDLGEDKGRGRCIRQLWDNPLNKGGWDPVFEGTPNTNAQQQNNGLQGNNRPEDGGRNRLDDGRGGNQELGPLGQPLTGSQEVRIGPIIGVTSSKKPEMVERNIPRWNFTIRLLQTRAVGTGDANPNRNLPINSELIGLPLPGSPAGSNSPGTGNLDGSVGGTGAIGGGGNLNGNRG